MLAIIALFSDIIYFTKAFISNLFTGAFSFGH